MRQHVISLMIAGFLSATAFAQSPFSDHFEDAGLRVDYHHTGNAEEEIIAVDRLYRQGVWAGSRTRLIDYSKYGGYQVVVRDTASGDLLYSRGFDSYFGEYRTTGPATEGVMKTYHETVLVPFPKKPVIIDFTATRRDGTTVAIKSLKIDPSSIEITTEPPAGGTVIVEAHIGGEPHHTLDIAIIGEGYTVAEKDLFRSDVAHAAEVLLGHEPYAAQRANISVRGVMLPSRESGCDEPTRGIYRDTPLGVSFNSFGSERYMLTEDNRSLRDIAANVPYDALVIMVNHDRYGGGGIYNLFSTFTAHSEWADYLLLHEFGHSFAGLADEYYSSSVAYNDFYPPGREPVEPNITALLDPLDFPWPEFVKREVPIPTPWEKEEYDRRDAAYQIKRTELNDAIAEATRNGASKKLIDELTEKEKRHAADHAAWAQKYLAESKWAGLVGAFEGAGYSSTGLYRPALDCLMFSRRVQPFCPVCERAVDQAIEQFTK